MRLAIFLEDHLVLAPAFMSSLPNAQPPNRASYNPLPRQAWWMSGSAHRNNKNINSIRDYRNYVDSQDLIASVQILTKPKWSQQPACNSIALDNARLVQSVGQPWHDAHPQAPVQSSNHLTFSIPTPPSSFDKEKDESGPLDVNNVLPTNDRSCPESCYSQPTRTPSGGTVCKQNLAQPGKASRGSASRLGR